MEKFVFPSIKILFWILLGSILKFILKQKKFDILQPVNKIARYVINSVIFFIIPYFLFLLIWETGINFTVGLITFSICIIIVGISYFFSRKMEKFSNFSFKEVFFPLTFMNTLYLGVPVTEYFVGKEFVHYTIIYSITVTLLQFSLGIYLLSGGNILSLTPFFLPITFSTAGGLVLNSLSLNIPEILVQTKNFISYILSPLMLILIGISLSWSKMFKNIRLHIFSCIVLRITVGLVISLFVCLILKTIREDILNINLVKSVVLVSTLPSAVVNYIVLEKLGINTDFVSGEILWGTLLYIFSLPYISELIDLFILVIF